MTRSLKPLFYLCLMLGGLLALNGCASDGTGISNSGSGRFDTPSNREESDERKRAKIRLELAVNYFQQKQGKIALEEVNNALTADNKLAEAHVLKGLILMEAAQNAPADESFKQALRLSPEDPDANNTYGWFLCQTGRESQSFALFNKAASTPFYATPAKPLQNAGICAMQQKNYPLAESYLLRAQEQDAGLLSISFHLGQLYLKLRDAPKANAYSRRLLTSSRPTAETLWLGIRAAHLNNDAVAKAQLVQVLRNEHAASPQYADYTRGLFD
jgi:type IV pilus assembly protein PilF